MRSVLAALVERRLQAPGLPLSPDEVFEAGWPSQRITPESAANRVYVCITRLRKLGLGERLVTTTGGFMLEPNVPMRRAPR
jgi:hypothetical protein